MKVAVITPIPTPYRDPLWNAVAKRPDIDLSVYYCSAGKRDRPWNVDWACEFRAEVLPGWNLAKHWGDDASCFWNPRINQRLRRGKFDAIVVVGYNHPTMCAAMRFAVSRRTPYYLLSESYLRGPDSVWKRWLKQFVVRRVVTNASGGFPTGARARQFLTHYGAHPNSLQQIPNVPDVAHLRATSRRLRRERDSARPTTMPGCSPTILFVGRLIPKKRADLLLRAFAQAQSCTHKEAQLVIVGDGPQRRDLEQLARDLGIAPQVRFVGFVQPAEVPHWLAKADLFVLPSSETWGVAVLEALASGIRVITTDEVGCHSDVMIGSELGEVVPARDLDALACALRRQLAKRVEPETVHRNWKQIAEHLSYDVLAASFAGHLHKQNDQQHSRAA